MPADSTKLRSAVDGYFAVYRPHPRVRRRDAGTFLLPVAEQSAEFDRRHTSTQGLLRY